MRGLGWVICASLLVFTSMIVQFSHLEHMDNSNDENLNEASQNVDSTVSSHARASNVGDILLVLLCQVLLCTRKFLFNFLEMFHWYIPPTHIFQKGHVSPTEHSLFVVFISQGVLCQLCFCTDLEKYLWLVGFMDLWFLCNCVNLVYTDRNTLLYFPTQRLYFWKSNMPYTHVHDGCGLSWLLIQNHSMLAVVELKL